MDILPTIAEYTGIDISQNPVIDGKSVKTLVENPETASSPHKYFLYYDGDGEVLRAIRDSAGYKLQTPRTSRGNEVNELYYLPEDISSTRNIADYDPQKVRELQNAADSLNSEITSGIRPRWSNETEEETKKEDRQPNTGSCLTEKVVIREKTGIPRMGMPFRRGLI